MSRSPLAYPLTRGFDAEGGGAADLQTDIMRFMAILSLCLMAIFALVQSLPMTPEAAPEPVVTAPRERQPAVTPPQPVVEARKPAVSGLEAPERVDPVAAPTPSTKPPVQEAPRPVAASIVESRETPAEHAPPREPSTPADEPGFTLRFASDLALTRLVARGEVAFYALYSGRAQRLTIRDSRLSFWASSTPATFHEMKVSTVPRPVVTELARAGTPPDGVRWGVTLPPRMTRRLDALMDEHRGGALVIGADGTLTRESS